MDILTKLNGVKEAHTIPSGVMAVVHPPEIKVEAPTAYTITSEDTLKCMRGMSEAEWVHISTGPLFPHFFKILFPHDSVQLPATVKELVEDYSEGVVHGCGLIVLLCEAMFDGRPRVFLKNPENHMHPKQQALLMSVILAIRKMSGGVHSNPSSQILGD